MNNEVIIDYHDHNLRVGGITLPFVAKNALSLKNTQVLKVEARSQRTVVAQVMGHFKAGEDVYVEGGFVDKECNLFIPRSVGRVSKKGKVCLEISNLAKRPLSLRPDMTIASGQKLEKANQNLTIEGIDQDLTDKEWEGAAMGHLNKKQQDDIRHIVGESGIKLNKLGRVKGLTTSIDTTDESPINVRQYRLPIAKRLEARSETNKMLQAGVIRESKSPWNSPVVLVKKPSGGTRFAIDFRQLNAVTKRQVYPMPRIDDCLNSLGTGTHFSLLDLQSAFWQVELEEDSKPKTAFSVDGMGHFEFEVMPYGLMNAAAVFQRMMDHVLRGLHWTHVLCYIDDVIVFGSNWAEHNERLAIVLEKLAGANLGLNLAKCSFGREEVKYLGHIIGHGQVRADPDKVAAVEQFPCPKSATEVRSFLGLASYYRRFVRDFASVTKPLTELTKTKGVPKFQWSAAAEEAFQAIKSALINAPCLTCLDQSAPLILQVDASQVGLGAVLCVNTPGEGERPIAFASRQLKASEAKYSSIQKEALALVWGLQHFHYWVFGQRVTLVTDHCPLSYLKSMAPKSQLLSRWLLILQCYDFTIIHRPGKANANADALSRCPLEGVGDDTGKTLCPTFIEANVVSREEDDIAMAQDEDEEIAQIRATLEGGGRGKTGVAKKGGRFTVEGGVLYHYWEPRGAKKMKGRRRKQLVVPQSRQGEILLESHDAGHPGYIRTLAKIREAFYWPSMVKDVSRHLKNCTICKAVKSAKGRKAPLKPLVVSKPLETISMDVVGPLPVSNQGNKYIITMMDLFSRWPAAYPVADMTAETVVRCIKTWGGDFGYPESVLTDRGTNFASEVFAKACKALHLNHVMTTAYRPQTNGMLERLHYTLKSGLATYPVDDWDNWVGDIVAAYRATPHTETRETPGYIFLGREMNVNPNIQFRHPIHDYGEDFVKERVSRMQKAHQLVRECNQDTQARNKERYDAEISSQEKGFSEGEWVWVKVGDPGTKGPLDRVRWTGPYKIRATKGTHNVEVTLPGGDRRHPIFHVNRLKRDDAVQREDIKGRVEKVLSTRKVRGLNGRLVTKAFIKLEGGYTMRVPSTWVE